MKNMGCVVSWRRHCQLSLCCLIFISIHWNETSVFSLSVILSRLRYRAFESSWLMPLVCRKTLKVGSDCSGLGTDVIALRRLGLQVNHVFSSDTSVHCRKVLQSLGLKPSLSMKPTEAPEVDLYTCGFPCQPYSFVLSQSHLLIFIVYSQSLKLTATWQEVLQVAVYHVQSFK